MPIMPQRLRKLRLKHIDGNDKDPIFPRLKWPKSREDHQELRGVLIAFLFDLVAKELQFVRPVFDELIPA